MHCERPIQIICEDGVKLGGHLWLAERKKQYGRVILNPATGVLARYYHRYALFLAEHGFDVLTYDYRGIGASRPSSLWRCGYRWSDWGEYDFDAAVRLMCEKDRGGPLLVVGHSIGGFLPGLAESATKVDRMLTVGAQYAWWLDYAPKRRAALFLKWHVAMPFATAICGYFPGRRLGWLEDLPAGVANEWSFRRSRMELSYPRGRRHEVLAKFEAVTAPILAVTAFDDEYATLRAVRRGLGYYRNAPSMVVELGRERFGGNASGHFGLFNSGHKTGFWSDTTLWLRDGINPWTGYPRSGEAIERKNRSCRPSQTSRGGEVATERPRANGLA
ncbi:alpha/beta hydrolase family protein [Pseudaminobacter sp. NGMCC 1.201702]|uniref:alpha/beta hydrolase family protein n=1 Tax=Pseudaminobacter sp. NGMCC 1.201702 TaxID=3391825 RepID=UPI0039EFDE07